MAVRVQAFRGAPTLAPKRIIVPKAPLTYVPVKQVRPAMLQSEFISPVASIKGLCSSFTNFVLSPFRSLVGAARRLPLLVEANRKKGLGCTLHGTRRKRARVSGFRARMSSPGGKKVLAARRKRGRKVLCPASVPKRKV